MGFRRGTGALLDGERKLANPSFGIPKDHNGAFNRLLRRGCVFESQNIEWASWGGGRASDVRLQSRD